MNRTEELMENTTGMLWNYYAIESGYLIVSQVGETRAWADVPLVLPAMKFWCDIDKDGVPPATS